MRSGVPCQDEVGMLQHGDVCAVAVSDGHGTSRFADQGARAAVAVALRALSRFADNLARSKVELPAVREFASHPLRVQIIRDWADEVRSIAGCSDIELIDYGATLLFAVATESFLLLGQLGDGDMLLVSPDGVVSTPIPADPAAFADETPSLCQREAWAALRIRAIPVPAPGTLLLLATDGYSKSYESDQVFAAIGPDYLKLVRTDGFHAVVPHLREFLAQVTQQGSGDDISLALLYWPPMSDGALPGSTLVVDLATRLPDASVAPPETLRGPNATPPAISTVEPPSAGSSSRASVGDPVSTGVDETGMPLKSPDPKETH